MLTITKTSPINVEHKRVEYCQSYTVQIISLLDDPNAIRVFSLVHNFVCCILDTLPPLPPLPPDVPEKTYINPLIYVDVVEALQEFTNEIDPASLYLENLIGAGVKIHSFIIFSFYFVGEYI